MRSRRLSRGASLDTSLASIVGWRDLLSRERNVEELRGLDDGELVKLVEWFR